MDGFDSRYNVQLTYDGLNRLDKIQDSYLGTGDVNYDTLGNITYYKIGSRVLNYHYNSKNQLHEITGSKPYTFTYDDMGNVKNNSKRNFTYKTDNLMVESDGYLYTYDGNSKRVKEIGSSGNPSYSFYGTNGKLMYRKENNQHIDYYYLGNKLVAIRKEDIDTNISTTTYIHADYLGSPAAESRSNGFLTKRLHYQPFGESIEPPKDDVGYTGHKFDTDLGLNYMQARYYDPVIGRFMSNDPVDAVSHLGTLNGIHGFNRYAYANNNPIKYTDPTGMLTCEERVYCDEVIINGMDHRNDNSSTADEIDVNAAMFMFGAGATAAQIYASEIATTFGLTSNGSFRFYESGWKGNQYMTMSSFKTLGNFAGGAGVVTSFVSNGSTLFDNNSSLFQKFEAAALMIGSGWGYSNPYVAGVVVTYEFNKIYMPNVLYYGPAVQGKAIREANLVPLYRNFEN